MNVVTLENIEKSYGIKTLFKGVNLTINDDDKYGILGINGTGKSTLLKIIQGSIEPDQGMVSTMRNIRIESLQQSHNFDEEHTILEEVLSYASESSKDMPIWDLESQAKTMLTTLGIHDYQRKIKGLSGGQKKRIVLAAALLSPSDLLILDEPTNHMDNDTINWLESYLKRRKGALLMITHDRYFLDRVVNKTLEISLGSVYEYEGNYTTYIEKKLERLEMEHRQDRRNENMFRRELAWVRRGARARSTKQKARIQRFEEIKASRGMTFEGEVELETASARLGSKTVELYNVCKSFGDLKVLDDFTYTLLRDDRIGIIGDNGKGKTTLLNIISQRLQPDHGRVEIGSTVRIGYFSQESEAMDERMKAIDYIKETAENFHTPSGKYVSASKLMENFLFDSDLQHTFIHKLSGGEKRRLFLMKILIDEPNVLLLDEPTNDLDIDTLKVLERYLDNFQGIVVTVSHDRYFLDRTCHRIFALKDQGHIHEYMGTYSDYLEEYQSEEAARTLGTTVSSSVGKVKVKQERVKNEKAPKLTYNENREFETIESEIEELEKRLDQIQEEVQKSLSDYTRLQELDEENEVLELDLLEKMERFEYLSEKYTQSMK